MEMIFQLAKKNTSAKVQRVVKELDALGLEEISRNQVLYSICIILTLSFVVFYTFQINSQNPVNAAFYCS